MSDDTNDTGAAAAKAASAAAAEAGPRTAARREHDEAEFEFARLLDPREGPQILRREWHSIAGAFHEEVAKLATDVRLAAKKMSRSAAVKKIDEWLGHEEQVDNVTGLPGEPEVED